MADKKTDEVERALGEPVLADLPDELRRTKRNLLMVSSAAIFSHFAKVQITESGFLGFKFSNPEQVWFALALFSLVAYLFVQFAWRAIDYATYTRLRVTGTRLRHVTTAIIGSEDADYPSDPLQSTLYCWWLQRAKRIGNFASVFKELKENLATLQAVAKEPPHFDMPNINHITQTCTKLTEDISRLERSLNEVEKTITSVRVPVSLERFDRWFLCFKTSQVVRVLVLDLVFPVAFGIAALVLACNKAFEIF
jgi:hypothetical protein